MQCSFALIQCNENEIQISALHYCYKQTNETWTLVGKQNGQIKDLLRGETSKHEKLYKEYCLPKSDDMIYTLIYESLNPPSDKSESYLVLYGPYNNLITKVSQNAGYLLTYSLDFNTYISANSSVKYSNTQVENWYKSTFNDDSWSTITLGSSKETTSTSDFYRIPFNAVNVNMIAAYTLGLLYNGNIAIYLNDVLVYHNNENTYNNFDSTDFMKVILSAYPLQTHNILAISISSTSSSSSNHINVFFTPISATLPNKCAYVVDTVTILDSPSSSTSEPASNLFDYRLGWQWHGEKRSDIYVEYQFDNNTYIQVNGYAFAPLSYTTDTPTSYDIYGYNSESQEYIPIDMERKIVSESNKWYNYTMPPQTNAYNKMKLYILNNHGGSNTVISEFYIYTCNISPEPLSYPSSTYNRYVYMEAEDIVPAVKGYNTFSISPDLPVGMSIDNVTGIISGTLVEPTDINSYTITALHPVQQTVVLTLNFKYCSQSHLKIVRQYGSKVDTTETYSISNTITGEVILEEKANTTQKSSDKIYYELCVDEAIYQVHYGSSNSLHEWSEGSYLYVYTKQVDFPSSLLSLDNTTLIYKGRQIPFENSDTYFSTKYYIKHQSEWKYKTQWYSNDWYKKTFDDSDWTLITWPQQGSIKHIELYRKTFTIESVDIHTGIEIEANYLHGIMIYINDIEVFKNRIPEGEITIYSNATSRYTEVKGRKITVPSSSLVVGRNVISIMILGDSTVSQEGGIIYKHATDFSVRDINKGPSFSFYDAVTMSSQSGNYPYIHDHIYSTTTTFFDGQNITFKHLDDEYIWVNYYSLYIPSSVKRANRPESWTIKAAHCEGDNCGDWVIIDHREHIYWSDSNYRQFFYIPDHTGVYNRYMIDNVSNTIQKSSSYEINELEFYSSSLSLIGPTFNYPSSSYSFIAGLYIDMIIPSTLGVYNTYTVSPSLPTGISLDKTTGIITGMSLDQQGRESYKITATKESGETVETQIDIEITACNGKETLMSIDFAYPFKNLKNKINIYNGISTTETPLYSITPLYLPYEHEKNYNPETEDDFLYSRTFSYCLPISIYTIEFIGTEEIPFVYPMGYILREGYKNIIDSRTLPGSTTLYQISIDLTKPMEIGNNHEYKINYEELSEWYSEDYNDASWNTVQGGNVSKNIHTYLRYSLDLLEPGTHSVMEYNIYTDCICTIYINGIYILEYTPKEEDRYMDIQSKRILYKYTFSIPLQTYFLKKKNNIIAIYMKSPDKTQTDHFYDMDIIYRYGTCSPLIPHFSSVSSSPLANESTLNALFDVNTFTSTSFLKSDDIYVDIQFVNDQLSFFNTINLQFADEKYPSSIYIEGKEMNSYEWVNVLNNTIIKGTSGNYYSLPVPLGVIGFPYLRIHFNSDSSLRTTSSQSNDKDSVLILHELTFTYCRYTDSICIGEDTYPTIGEDEYSYTVCGQGYEGYKYRYCNGIHLKKENTDHCHMLAPLHLRYSEIQPSFNQYEYVNISKPTYDNIISSFTIKPALPYGILLHADGSISGKASNITSETIYTISGTNERGTVTAMITFSIIRAYCSSLDTVTMVPLDSHIDIPCPSGYFGTQSRSCVVINNNVEWTDITGECTNASLIYIVIACVLVTIIAIIYVLIKRYTLRKNMEELANLRKKVGGVVNKNETHIIVSSN